MGMKNVFVFFLTLGAATGHERYWKIVVVKKQQMMEAVISAVNWSLLCFSVSVPPNAISFRSTGQDETSITLQWNTVNNNISFILQFNGTEINITAPVGGGPVTHTVSSLTAGTKYTFTLFSVFENVRSSGVNLTAVTGKMFESLVSGETKITLMFHIRIVHNTTAYMIQDMFKLVS